MSDVQRRQMTTPSEANVHAIAIQGTFDDCQNLVKAAFNDLPLRDRLQLAGVNSINWARLMAQIVYYFTSAVALGAPDRRISYSVPTGNFGDIFAGYAARCMGLPIDRLVIATNVNDILVRTFETGRYEPRGTLPTESPSMDIQISSNFERLLFELAGRDARRLAGHMTSLGSEGFYTLDQDERASLQDVFQAARVDQAEARATIARLARETGYVADPHTAIGIAAAGKVARDPTVPMVMLATAHPAKFPDAIKAATGAAPAVPAAVARQAGAPERITLLPNSLAEVARHVAAYSRAGRSSP